MTTFAEYAEYDGLGLADLVRRKEVSPAELVASAYAAIERLNPRLNAVVGLLEDHARSPISTIFATVDSAAEPFTFAGDLLFRDGAGASNTFFASGNGIANFGACYPRDKTSGVTGP